MLLNAFNFILDTTKQKPIGIGTQARIYDVGKYVVRIPLNFTHDSHLNYEKIEKIPNIWQQRNFGQALYGIVYKNQTENFITINKKAYGFPTNDFIASAVDTKQIIAAQQTAITKMKIIAAAPQKSFERLIDDLNYINTTGFTIDPSEGNMLFNPNTKRFHIIDLRYVKKVRNIGDIILLLLTDIPNMPENREYFDLEQIIITKLINAANYVGVISPEQLVLKPRALEVIKSDRARKIYIAGHDKFPLQTMYDDASEIYKNQYSDQLFRRFYPLPK